MEINADAAHWLRMYKKRVNGEAFALDQLQSELQRKRELEAGIMTWVTFDDMEEMYFKQGRHFAAAHIARLRADTRRRRRQVYAVVCSGGGGGAGYVQTAAIPVGAGSPPPPAAPADDTKQHRVTDVTPKPPLDWKNDIKKFDPFKGFKSERAKVNADGDLIYQSGEEVSAQDTAGPLGKSFQPPTANGKSSWPGVKW